MTGITLLESNFKDNTLSSFGSGAPEIFVI